MPASIRIEAEALKLRVTVAELRRFAKAGLIEVVERDQVAAQDVRALLGLAQLELRPSESASKAQLILGLLRTRQLNLTQIGGIVARLAPPYRLEDIRWV